MDEEDEVIIQWMLTHMNPRYREDFHTMVRRLQRDGYVVGIRFFMYRPPIKEVPGNKIWQQVLSIDTLDELQ